MKKLFSILIILLATLFLYSGTINVETEIGTTSYNLEDITKISIINTNEMILVEGGSFEMGDHNNEGDSDELPVHNITLNSYYIGKFELTHYEYLSFLNACNVSSDGTYNGNMMIIMNDADSAIKYNGDNFYFESNSHVSEVNCPIILTTWYGAAEYCNWLSEIKNLSSCYTITPNNIICDFNADGYRIPTEAEWEYAARGGVNHTDNYRYSGCHDTSSLMDYAWYSLNSSSRINPIGMKLPNQLGIHDMSGNTYEWCWDWHDSAYYSAAPQNNPTGPESGTLHVVRSGSWYHNSANCRVSDRNVYPPHLSDSALGFRLVRNF